MKKLLTLIAFLAVVIGANAKEIVDAYVDFSTYSDISEVKWAGWGASESARARLSIKDGCLHFESTEATDPSWDCQFHPIGFGSNAEIDVTYTLHFKVKGDHAGNVSMLGFGQTPYGQFAITEDWVEGTVDYVATSTSGDINIQCGEWVGTWDIAYLKITHEGKEERPVEWVELLTNGNAETPWTDVQKNILYNDTENNFTICAWSMEKGHNMDDNGVEWNPFVATIVEDPTNPSNHVFLCDGQPATTEGDAAAWDNMFWIEAPRQIKAGEQVKIHFRYMASEAANTNTQIHHQTPSDYMHWQAINDVAFTTEWQTYDQVVTWPSGGDDKGWSIAFNLNAQNKNAVKFYFDDLSIQEMKLDRGLFVASSNTKTGMDYYFDNATEFVYDDELEAYVATVGTAGKQDTWVNQVMISTVRGNDRMFKANTIKITGTIDGTEDAWPNFTEASNAKTDLPAAGVWRIAVDTENNQANFLLIEGEELVVKEAEDIVTNATEVIVKGQERQPTASEQPADPDAGIEEGTGQPWDNQFFLIANRVLEAGEVTIVKFQYKANKEARTTTQTHGQPGGYIHWAAIGDVNFTEEWQDFEYEYTIPSEASGKDAQSIAFNMAEIKDACDYELKNFQWYLKYDEEEGKTMENLIDAEGTKNFYVKEGAGTDPYEFDPNSQVIVEPTEKLTLSVPKTISAGQEFLVSVEFDNERTDYTAFKMDIQVSEGISFAQELNDDEELAYAVTLNADRKKSDHSLATNLINANTLRITCFSSTNKTFKGTSGEIVSLKLKAENWVKGDALVCLQDAYFSTTDEKDVYMNDNCYYISVASADQTQWLKEDLGNTINDVENRLSGMIYQNVAGKDSLNTLLNTGRQMLNQDILTEEEVRNLMDMIWQQFEVVRELSDNYANLAERLNSLATIMTIVEVSETQATEINTFTQTVSQGLAAGSYGSEDIAQLYDQVTVYLELIGNVSLTINLEQENTLSEKLSAFSSDYSIIKGLTITGALGSSDLSFIRNNLYGLITLDMLGTTLTTINKNALSGMTNLEEVVLPQGLTNLGNYAFQNCYALKRVVLPATLTYIYPAFRGCSSLREIVCNALVPPTASNYIIDGNTEYMCTLIVPMFSVEDYRNANYWYMFKIEGSKTEDLIVSGDYYLNTNDEMYKELKNINVAMRELGKNYYELDNYNIGALVVEGDSMLSVNDYKMAYAPYVQYITKNYGYNGRRASSVLINNAPMRADNVAINLTLQANIWQFISLPFDIKVSDINWDSNDQPYAIYKYDGKKRADQDMQNTWVRMTADSTLQAGVGYIWQVPNRYDEFGYFYDNVSCELKARDNENKNNIFLNDNAEVKMAEYLSEFVQDRSWNLLGNPYPAYFASRAMDITSPFTVWNISQQNYEAYSPVDDDYVFAPGEAFFFQRPLDQANITFLKDGRQTDGYSYGNVFFNGARQSDMTARRSVFNLILSDDKQMDRTRFVINEESSLSYEMDKDASKFASMNANAVQLYTIDNGVRYAINERPLSKGEITLGMSMSKKGTYTLKLDTKVDNEVILVDRLTGDEVLLNEQDYTFTTEAGKTESRFMVRLGAGDATGISLIQTVSEDKGVIYDLSGRRIDNSQKRTANGLYIINGKKVVVK